MPEPLPDFATLAGQLARHGVSSAAFAALDDAALVAAVEAITALRHDVERCQAVAAAEVARRSRVGFGVRGLAQRAGHASTGQLLQSITRASKRDTAALVEVGRMIADTDAAAQLAHAREADPALAAVVPEPVPPWFAELGRAVAGGALTVGVAEAIRSGLGEPGGDADETLLAMELAALIPACRGLHADAARRAARQARDRIDAAGVTARAEQQRAAQFWRVWVKPDGMVRGEFELEPEAGMLVKAVFDQLTHPRRTHTTVRRRFGDPVTGDTAYTDARAVRERDAADGLTQLLRAGATTDPARLLHGKKPAVRLIVNAHTLATGSGTGLVEGHPDRIPLPTVHAGLCEGHLPVRFDATGAPLDLGREVRLFTEQQKTILAIRDGGCMDPDCTRPPSWTEAHHIHHWHRDHGHTNVADGILLCRRDHLRYHNQGFEIRRDGTTYWLIPPPHIDPEQTPRLMRPKTPADIINPVDSHHLPPDPHHEPEHERERLPIAG
jgi:Domain of unknown function (DUF222)